jgi:hypothetical protein
MKKGILIAVAAGFAAFGTPAAQAYNLCMSTPLASFDGGGQMSPDGKYLAAGGKLFGLPDLREIGSIPSGGQFTADNHRYYRLLSNGTGGLDLVDVATPSAVRHINFTTTQFAQVSPQASLVLIHPGRRSVSNPNALGGTDDFYSWRLLRTSDGAQIAGSDNVYESYDFAVDASESHAFLYAYTDHPSANFAAIIDIASGQVRELRTDFGQNNGAIAIAPDGRVAATNSFDGDRVVFFDTASGNRLGTVAAGSGMIEAVPDSSGFVVGGAHNSAFVVRAGNWSSPLAVAGLDGSAEYLRAAGGGVIGYTSAGRVAAVDTNMQRRFEVVLGGRLWDTPRASAQGEIVVRTSNYDDHPDDGQNGLSALVLLDGRSGRALCEREAPPPTAFENVTLSATQLAVVVNSGKPDYKQHTEFYAIEDEAAARARVQREAAQAKATSAKLAPAKHAEAQGIFKQAFDLFQAGEFASAVKLFDAGLAIDPGNAPANYFLGESYTRMGDKDRAAVAYTRAAIIAPTSKEGALASTRLGN